MIQNPQELDTGNIYIYIYISCFYYIINYIILGYSAYSEQPQQATRI